MSKLKTLGILSKTKTISDLSNIVYKKMNDTDEVKTLSCKVLGVNFKENPKDCINKTYENLIIEVNNNTFDINIDYLKDMQSKSWGQKEDTNITTQPPISNNMDIFIHLFTKPRGGVILKKYKILNQLYQMNF